MLDYRIETFLVVCQEMNFTKASKRLGISQPAVSNQIRQLEEYYDALLFGYQGKKVYLTKEGKLLYEAMVKMYNNEIYIMEQINQCKEERENIRLGVTEFVDKYILKDALENYMINHPDVQLYLEVGTEKELLGWLDTGHIDFAVTDSNYSSREYESLHLFTENFFPVCSPYSNLAKKQVGFTSLTMDKLITDKNTYVVLEKLMEEKNARITDFPSVLQLGNIDTVKELVKSNLGVSFMYERTVRRELMEEELVKINIKGWNVKREFNAIWRKDKIFSDYYERQLKELLK